MLNICIQKSFFDEKLSVRVAANDIFHTMKHKQDVYLRNIHFWQVEDQKMCNVTFSIVYRLNKIKTNYRGKNAASDLINRI
jgi:hypothetical protein